jgi:hypothetical protein
MNPLDRKSSKTTTAPLINRKCRLNFSYMPAMRSVGMGLVSFFACTALGLAAADFKIRYNQKFPCLEVMDSSAVKITDVTEGAKGETVTAGKSSLNISFVKNSSGQPEVTFRDAKSPLSEMEIEAFGLSVGMKPEGTVLVRFGADNKPKFEMDRTGGSRFLMADLGNLDTAAGKEVAGNAAPSKNLIRCRERFAEWLSGKGGWSNKSGKIIASGGGNMVTEGDQPEREIKVSEAFQRGAKITVGLSEPMMFQSGAGVFHLALPGAVFSLGKLEAGSPDLKVELIQGTVQTFVAAPLVAPRASLISLGNGEVARTLDGSYQIAKSSGAGGTTTITIISGKVILAQEAGGKELATLTGEQTWSGPKGGETKALPSNSPEKSSLVALQKSARDNALIDIARDGVKACPEAVEEIVSTAVKANPELAPLIASQCLLANPKLLKGIAQASGVKGLKLSKEEQAKVDALDSLDQRLERLAIEGIDLEMKMGQVLLVEGDCKLDGKKEKILVGQVLALNDKIATGKNGRILVGMAPGVVLSVEPESVVSLEKMSAEIKNGELLNRAAVVNTESGLVVMNIAPWNKEKTDVRVKTTEGESVAQGTVFAVNFSGGKMVTTVTRGSVGSTDASGKSVSISMGQQASPGGTPASTPANSPAVAAAGNAVAASVNALVANVAASIAAAIPSSAAEVAAVAAKAVPAAAEQIAGAVAAKAPEAALAIAQAVSKVAPEAASRIAAAVIAATPGMDAKSISAITTASSQGAADAPSVDTASGTEGGTAGSVGAGSGSVGQAAAATQFQQLQAEQDNQAAQDALKAARDAEAAAKAALFAANEREYARALEVYNRAVAAREAAQAAANTAALAKAVADAAAATATSTAASTATASQNAANAAETADAAARAAAEAAATVDALAKGLADNKTAADEANTAIQSANTKGEALAVANSAVTDANSAFDQAKSDQEAAAAQAVALERAEIEAVARASAATEAAQAAAQLQAALDAATTKAQQNAAAEAAKVAAAAVAANAAAAANAATAAATSAQTASTTTFNSLTTENQNLASDYKLSNPAAIENSGTRSTRSMFTQAELAANPTLKTFVEQWDAFIDKQMEKFAALAKQAAKEAALLVAQQTETAIKAAADMAAAKAAAQAALNAANTEKTDKENARIAAELAALAKGLEDARLKGEREAAEVVKAAAAKLAADIAAAADTAAGLLASKLKATEAAAAIEAQRVAEAAKVAAAEAEAARLANLETQAAAVAAQAATEAANAAIAAATQAAEAAAKAAAAAAAAAAVPPVVTPPTNPNATPTRANA